ncbi:hypothetical protein V502_10683 [Pseudogymnoascus sp. VKM F-4520 (FW-2644)]|nr:hypothetical protein V502_10683 [Pseudogymnoascus sp. VKM F-4520 (FW-2644)]
MASIDYKVLEAQRWLNKTYADDKKVEQYVRVVEDGITGWKTMYALIRAMQWEIGIEQLADSFGPTTLKYLDARGGIGDWNGGDLVQIVQCAFYCKGYSTGGMDGRWGDDTTAAATQMCSNAGIYTGSDVKTLKPKTLKSLFSMDAHVMLPGGSGAVRSFQQWLNGRYLGMMNFYIIPADGIFSRDVQKALYLAIQSEMGLADAAATGSFGPATKSYLQSHEIRSGSGGPLVQILTGAMICQRVKTRDGTDFIRFTDGFDGIVSDALVVFQTFSELPTTGYGDFATWCQLLVSTGDPNRPGTAFDCSTPLTPTSAQALKAAGYRYVGRYLDNVPGPGTLNKKIQPMELLAILSSGLRVFPISQYNGTTVTYFTELMGRRDGQLAHTAAVGHGFPIGTVIYFAVDFDATQAEINSNVIPYFLGVKKALKENDNRYIHGVYGSRNVCADVSREPTSARYSFVSGMSSGFSGNMGFPLPENWSFNQIQNLKFPTAFGTIEIDKDVYKTGGDRAVDTLDPPGSPPSTVDRFLEYVGKLQGLAQSFAAGKPGVRPNQLVLQYMRHPRYTDLKWITFFGPVSYDFFDFVDAQKIPLVKIKTFIDPIHPAKQEIHVDHLAAACNIIYDLGQPVDVEGKSTVVDMVDISGWGGDWVSFYGDWVAADLPPASGYCKTYLAKSNAEAAAVPNYRSHLTLRDLIEDVDAYCLAMRIRLGPEAGIAEELSRWYLGPTPGAQRRFRNFTTARFGNGDLKANSEALAIKMLMPNLLSSSKQFLGAVKGIIWYTGGLGAVEPWSVNPSQLDELCQGFADMMSGMVAQETVLTP